MSAVIVTTPDELRALIRETLREELGKVKAQPVPVTVPDDEMTTADVCRLFKITAGTLWAWRRRGDNPFPMPRRLGKPGSPVRYLRSEVNTFRRNLERVSSTAA